MKKLIIAIACTAALASCVKEEDKKIVDVSKTAYLMEGKWIMTAYTWLADVNDTTPGRADMYIGMNACDKDDVWKFHSREGVTEYEMVKCNLTQPDSIALGYSLTNDDKYIKVFANPADPDNSLILSGDAVFPSIDTMIVTYRTPNPNDEEITSEYVKTYVRIK
jgi:hypothetical protein